MKTWHRLPSHLEPHYSVPIFLVQACLDGSRSHSEKGPHANKPKQAANRSRRRTMLTTFTTTGNSASSHFRVLKSEIKWTGLRGLFSTSFIYKVDLLTGCYDMKEPWDQKIVEIYDKSSSWNHQMVFTDFQCKQKLKRHRKSLCCDFTLISTVMLKCQGITHIGALGKTFLVGIKRNYEGF